MAVNGQGEKEIFVWGYLSLKKGDLVKAVQPAIVKDLLGKTPVLMSAGPRMFAVLCDDRRVYVFDGTASCLNDRNSDAKQQKFLKMPDFPYLHKHPHVNQVWLEAYSWSVDVSKVYDDAMKLVMLQDGVLLVTSKTLFMLFVMHSSETELFFLNSK